MIYWIKYQSMKLLAQTIFRLQMYCIGKSHRIFDEDEHASAVWYDRGMVLMCKHLDICAAWSRMINKHRRETE